LSFEHVVHEEGGPLLRRELLEHDEEGHRQVGGEIDARIRGNAIHPGEAKAA
jgi:hypothetical protein